MNRRVEARLSGREIAGAERLVRWQSSMVHCLTRTCWKARDDIESRTGQLLRLTADGVGTDEGRAHLHPTRRPLGPL